MIKSNSRKGLKRKVKDIENNVSETSKRKRINLGVESEKLKQIQYLTINGLLEDMIILGCIVEVKKSYMKFSLPGCLEGIVYFHTVFSNRKFEDDEVEVESLQSTFEVGQTLACKVIEIKKPLVSLKEPTIFLSVNPEVVNKDLKHSSLCQNMILNARVKSIEDQGYIMDIGIEVPGFINKNDANIKLKIGQIIQTVIINADISRPVVFLTVFNKPGKLLDEHKHSLLCFQPGTKVNAVVKDTEHSGVLLNIMGFTGCVCKEHLKYSVSTRIEVTGTVLYVHPVTHIVYLTLSKVPSLKMRKYKRWDIFDNATVIDIGKDSVFFNLEKDLKGQSMRWELSDKKIEDINIYTVNSTHRFRVLSLHPIDNIVRGTLKMSAFKLNIIDPTELRIGQIIKGKVKKFVKGGMIVKISPNIQGFIRDIHMTDGFVKNPFSLYKLGTEINCRILSMNFKASPYSLALTCKKALLKPDLLILSSYADATPGFVTKGVVVHIASEIVLLSFFNDVQGIVTQFHSDSKDLKMTYFVGQVLKCQILRSNSSKKLIHLSLKINTPEVIVPALQDACKISDISCGQVADVTILSKVKNGFHVKFQTNIGSAFLPFYQLSDIIEHINVLSEAFTMNDVIKILVFSHKTKDIIVTRKCSFIQTAIRQLNVKHISDLQVGKILPIVVKYYCSGGIVVDLGSDIIGFVPKKFIEDSSVRYHPGQSLMAKIIEIEGSEIKLSSRLNDVYNGNPDFSLDVLQCYLEDTEKITDYYKTARVVEKSIQSLKVGDIVSIKVSNISKKKIRGALKNGLSAVVDIKNCDINVNEDQFYEGSVLYVDYNKNCVELSLTSHVVKCVKGHKNSESTKAKVGQAIKSTAVLIKKEFILVHLEGHAVGSFAYLPSKKILNDEMGRSTLYSLGQNYNIVVKRILNGKILGVLKKHDKYVKPLVPDLQSSNIPSVSSSIQSDILQEQNIKLKTPLIKSSHHHISNYSNKTFVNQFDVEYSNQESIEQKYPVGKTFGAVVTGVKKFQVNIIINNELQGRIHITDLGCSTEGTFPLRKFSKGNSIVVRIIEFNLKKTHNYLEISHCYFKKYADCVLSECLLSSLQKEFNIGEDVIGFVKAVDNESVDLWLSAATTAKLPFLHMPLLIKEIRKIKKNYVVGQAVKAVIFDKTKDHYILSKFESLVFHTGMEVTAFVENLCPNKGLIIKLAHNYHGEISLQDISKYSNATEETAKMYLKRRFIKCKVLEIDEVSKSCNLLLPAER